MLISIPCEMRHSRINLQQALHFPVSVCQEITISAVQKPPGLLVLCFAADTDWGNIKSCLGLAQTLMANVLCQSPNADQHSLLLGMMQDKKTGEDLCSFRHSTICNWQVLVRSYMENKVFLFLLITESMNINPLRTINAFKILFWKRYGPYNIYTAVFLKCQISERIKNQNN